jgi:hypothetical protein
MAGVAAAAMPIFTEGHLAQAAMQTAAPSTAPRRPRRMMTYPEGAVLINANENPLGPCKAACEAIAAIAHKGGRYDIDGETAKLTTTFAKQNGLKEEYIAVYAGSSEPLHFTTLAFTSPTRGFVTADPSYEAGMMAAKVSGAKITKVPLTSTYAHDVKAMVAADPNAGVLYICNPNNPTGTLTNKEDIAWAVENKPKGSIILVDEAYIHLSDSPSVLDMVAADKDIVVLRTFSKVYGMAGIRCGFAVGRPDRREREPARPRTGARAQEDHRRHPQRHLRVAREEQLQVHPVAVQLLHDRYRAQRQVGDRGNAGEERLHRTDMAGVAEHRPHHRGQPGRHGEVQGGIQGSDGRAARTRLGQPAQPL